MKTILKIHFTTYSALLILFIGLGNCSKHQKKTEETNSIIDNVSQNPEKTLIKFLPFQGNRGFLFSGEKKVYSKYGESNGKITAQKNSILKIDSVSDFFFPTNSAQWGECSDFKLVKTKWNGETLIFSGSDVFWENKKFEISDSTNSTITQLLLVNDFSVRPTESHESTGCSQPSWVLLEDNQGNFQLIKPYKKLEELGFSNLVISPRNTFDSISSIRFEDGILSLEINRLLIDGEENYSIQITKINGIWYSQWVNR